MKYLDKCLVAVVLAMGLLGGTMAWGQAGAPTTPAAPAAPAMKGTGAPTTPAAPVTPAMKGAETKPAETKSMETKPAGAKSTETKMTATTPVNINTADEATLKTLPGIGAKKAQKIIAYREKNGPFKA